MAELYTLGLWKAKPGKEAEFIALWQEFADWTTGSQPGAGEGTLLQGEGEPQRFISFGPWADADSVVQWREQPKFKEFVAMARELCEEIEPQNMILVGRSRDKA